MSAARRTLLALVCALAASSTASAHSGHPILRAERTLKFVADGRSGLSVVVTLNLGPEQMLGRLRRADTDANGRVDATEASAFLRRWTVELRDQLPVYVDGERVETHASDPFLEPEGPIAMRPGTLEIRLQVPLDEGPHVAFVADRMSADEFDRTDVMYEVTNGARLVGSGPSASPTEVVPSFAYGVATDRRSVRSMGLSFELPPRASVVVDDSFRRHVAQVLFVVLGGPVVAVLLGRLVRAMRARDAKR